MRRCISLTTAVSLVLAAWVGRGTAQSCVGLQCQQQSCSANGTTSLTGTVYAPNGTDPLPNVTVYIPNDVVQPFSAGVSCPLVGASPSGSPLVGTETDVNGNFTLVNVPVGSNIPLVIVSGRWRRQLVIPSVTACAGNPMPANFAVMPADHTQGDIPKIAIATGSADAVECVLRKVGIKDTEFTDPTGSGRINLFAGGAASSSGAIVDAATPTQAALMANSSTLNQYDVLMLPCEGSNILKPAQELANLVTFANAGGRVYASHYEYSWMYQNAPFNTVANWLGNSGVNSLSPDPGTATVNTSFTGGLTLAQWLQLPAIAATTTQGQMTISTLRKDTNGVNPPTQTWLTLNNATAGNPVMQFVFDTPIATPGQTINQCGRVLYNEYHVENPVGSPSGKSFPTECTAGAMTPQEKLLEYMLFELTDDGGQPSLAPLAQDFGSEAIGFASAPVTFTWTNNSSFASQVTSAASTGDFAVTSNNCSAVPAGTSCQIQVVFTPTALGARTGSLTVVAQGNSLTASLTGTGTPGFSLSGSALSYGSLDVGANATQSLTLTSLASGPLPVPPFVTTGQYSVSTAACGTTVAAGASCAVKVTFLPTGTGPQNGTLGVSSTSLLYSGLGATLTGNGVDFTITLTPTRGSVVAGDSTTTTATLTPLAGFAAPLSLLCKVGAAASGCGLSTASVTPATVTNVTITMNTTSQYTVVGYGGFGGRGYLWLVGVGTGLLLWRRRKMMSGTMRNGLLLLLAVAGISLTGCSGKIPAQNSAYTGPGSYTVTVTATDGFLVHSATYTLAVSAK
jgi:Abnormal spindle-like microcephaly-assoc'd, ASPM-SPD-2-Hydin